MSGHLRECAGGMEFAPGHWWCICKELRACEQRVVDEARQVISALADAMADWSSEETTSAYSAIPEMTVGDWAWAQRGVQRALAALDDLGGQP